MSSVGCLIKSNADIAGVGARTSVYGQNLLCFTPAVWAIADGKVTQYELDSMETMSTTNLVVAFGILISSFVQARTLGLTNFHATIVLSMSWMNNTNVFIYFLLYAQTKGRDGFKGWWEQVAGVLPSQRFFRRAVPATDPEGGPKVEQGAYLMIAIADESVNRRATSIPAPPSQAPRVDIRRLFRRPALVAGSLHLTLMSTLGLWLWSDPRGFGTADSACAVDHAHLAIAGARVPFASNALRIFSLFIYALFLIPGLNLLLPMTVFLGIYYLHGKLYPEAHQAESAEEDALHAARPQRGTLTPKRIWSVVKRISSRKSPVFPAFLGLCFLLVINIVFIVDIELTLRNNRAIQESGEAEWGFGQVLAVLLLFLPLRDLVEMIFRRRQELQTQLDNELKGAVIKKDFEGVSKWAAAGANLDTKADGDKVALEVVCLESQWDILLALVENGANPNVVFSDGRTAMELLFFAQTWDILRVFIRKGGHINSRFADGRTALEVATHAADVEAVLILVELGFDINIIFQDGQTALEVAILTKQPKLFEVLIRAEPDLNRLFEDGLTILEVAAIAREWRMMQVILDAGAYVNDRLGRRLETLLESPAQAGNSEARRILDDLEAMRILKRLNSSGILILLMGQTGAGKSHFVNSAAGTNKAPVRDALSNSDFTVRSYTVHNPRIQDPGDVRSKVVLVDTPGLNNVNHSDTNIIKLIAAWLNNNCNDDALVGGIIFLHDIAEDRATAYADKHAWPVKYFDSPALLQHVFLTTGKWDLAFVQNNKQKYDDWERDLKETMMWRRLLNRGAMSCQYEGDYESAWKVIGKVLEMEALRAQLLKKEFTAIQGKLPGLQRPKPELRRGFGDLFSRSPS